MCYCLSLYLHYNHHFRFLWLVIRRQGLFILILQRQRIQSCEAYTIPIPATRYIQMFLLRTPFWFGTWHLRIKWRREQPTILYQMWRDVLQPLWLLDWKLRIFYRSKSIYSIWHRGFLRNRWVIVQRHLNPCRKYTMTKYIHSNPWQSSAILRAHALSQIQQQNTNQVIMATAANKLYPNSGYQCLSTKSGKKLIYTHVLPLNLSKWIGSNPAKFGTFFSFRFSILHKIRNLCFRGVFLLYLQNKLTGKYWV